ncbi:MAG TPA: DUF2442 domain-containing protein [Candidatus Ozemobacteraceae bacterium]|nr:DUF2442 domain-containing protein [Candidatus Ozemobacteraceae bacterium]HOY65794.1 DUF2442 domain-containing protein [Candidatus Ozemobacteraceae bacterium]
MKEDGFLHVKPCIKKIDFKARGAFSIHLADGRIMTVPLSAFPSIRKLTPEQRSHWYILDDMGFSFDECDEVFHLEQVFGNVADYRYSFIAPKKVRCVAEDPPAISKRIPGK